MAKRPPPPIGGFQDKLKTSEAVQCQVNRVDSVLLLIKNTGAKPSRNVAKMGTYGRYCIRMAQESFSEDFKRVVSPERGAEVGR